MKNKVKVINRKAGFIDKMNDVFIGVFESEDGKEGIIASVNVDSFPPTIQPMLAATQSDKDEMIAESQSIASKLRHKVRILKFSNPEIIAEFEPEEVNSH